MTIWRIVMYGYLLYLLPLSYAWSTNGSTWTYLKMETKYNTKPQVYDMEVDKSNPIRILFVTTAALYSTNGGDTMKLLAGSAEGYKEGLAEKAKFRTITSLVQKDERYVLLADQYNHCIREFDREKNVVSTFAGECERSGFTDGNMTGAAHFKEPLDLELSGNRLYMVERNATIRLVDLKTEQVSTLHQEQTTLRLPRGLVEVDNTHLFITSNAGVVHYSMTNNQTSTMDALQWEDPKKIIKLSNGLLAAVDGGGSIVVYSYMNSSIALLICNGKSRQWENGEADKCKLYGAYSILYHEKILYIGGKGQIMAIKLASNHSEIHESIYSHVKSTDLDQTLVIIGIVMGIILIMIVVLIGLFVRHRIRAHNRDCAPTLDTAPSPSSCEQQTGTPLLHSTSPESRESGSVSMKAAGSSSPEVSIKLPHD